MGAASTKAAVTVGVNVPLTSGKETGISSSLSCLRNELWEGDACR